MPAAYQRTTNWHSSARTHCGNGKFSSFRAENAKVKQQFRCLVTLNHRAFSHTKLDSEFFSCWGLRVKRVRHSRSAYAWGLIARQGERSTVQVSEHSNIERKREQERYLSHLSARRYHLCKSEIVEWEREIFHINFDVTASYLLWIYIIAIVIKVNNSCTQNYSQLNQQTNLCHYRMNVIYH